MTTRMTRVMLNKWNDILVPVAGEVVIEQGTNKIKIGDGKTNFANLPYVESDPADMTLSEQAKEFIENNIKYLEVDDYETFYSHITSVALAREVSKALFKAGLNPKEYLKECPRGCESVFYYEGKCDPNATIRGRGWTISHPIRGKAQYQWITTSPNSGKYWEEYITGYKTDERIKDLEKRVYVQSWMMEEEE